MTLFQLLVFPVMLTAPRDCLNMDGSLQTPCDDLQETPLGRAGYSWFTGGPYFTNKIEGPLLVMLLQPLLKSSRQHLYLWLPQPSRLNYMLSLGLVFSQGQNDHHS